MNKLLQILLVLGLVIGGFTIAVSADPIPSSDFQIDFTIEGGNAADIMHGEKGWLIAGSGVTSKIRVLYIGNKSPDIKSVGFTPNDEYGDVSNDILTSGSFETVFSASKNTAGKAPIKLDINYVLDDVMYYSSRTIHQPIDHNVPYKIKSLDFESEVTVGGETDITLKMEDKYGNTVNSLYESATSGTPETVTFSTTSTAGSGFLKGTTYSEELVSVPVIADGSAVAKFKVGTEAGPNYLIHMVPPSPLSDKWMTITAIGDAIPYGITVVVDPKLDNPPYIPADGKSKFSLIYTLKDEYGNPSGNQPVHFNDSVIHSETTLRTNSNGEVKFTFGPFDTVGLFNIHAYAVNNPDVTNDQELRFTNTDPENMLLTANPESMPSADVVSGLTAQIIAKVIDESGNGVPGETVTFYRSDGPWSSRDDPNLDLGPRLDKPEMVTNGDGIAMVNFTPGSLKKNLDDENNVIPALGKCTVYANWGTTTRQIDLEWRNYPYLRVETEVHPETVEVGNPVNVTIRLIGDGYALYPDPIDVMLCVDRSTSMLEDYPDRMVSAMDAMKSFNGMMEKDRDQVGLTSFGGNAGDTAADIFTYSFSRWAGKDDISTYWVDWPEEKWEEKWWGWKTGEYVNEDEEYVTAHYPGNQFQKYPDYATLDLALTKEIDEANTTVNQLVPRGGTPMRGGLHKAIGGIIDKSTNEKAVRAVILLTDGDYNYYGDPLARGVGDSIIEHSYTNGSTNYDTNIKKYYAFSDLSVQNQSMSAYASNNSIKIFSISFGNDVSTWGRDTLTTLAKDTGGEYYHAPKGDDLTKIYTDIAGALKTEAGVNTTMDLKFTNIELNNVSVPNDPADPFLKYKYVDKISTQIKSWNTTVSPPGSADNPNVIKSKTLDQRDDWAANQSLNFNITDIGTIHLHQTWQAVFMLNVTKAGNINIFGKGSEIHFNDEMNSLTLPKTYITAVADLNATGIDFTGLEVTDLICVEAENNYTITDYLTMNWNLTYSSSENTTTQHLYYQKESDGIWNKFGEKSPVSGPVSESLQTDKLYVADFPPGKYKLRVRAMADDAPDSVVETAGGYITIGPGDRFFIKLE